MKQLPLPLQLIADDYCYLCERHGYPLCQDCSMRITRHPLILEPIPGFSQLRGLGNYASRWRELILALKHDRWLRNSTLPKTLGAAMGKAIAADLLRITRGESTFPARALTVVPAPPSWKRRYHPLTREFAHGIAAGLKTTESFSAVRVQNCLQLPPGSGTQSGRARNEREQARVGQFIRTGTPSRHLLLVDDVVTTGGTLRAMAAALRSSNTGTISACVLATAHS